MIQRMITLQIKTQGYYPEDSQGTESEKPN